VKYLHKLLMGFSIAFLFVALTGTVAMYLSQQALKESIGNGFIELAEEAIDKIDRSISKRIEQAEAYAINVAGDPDLRESNTRFAAMDDVQGYIDEQEREWRAAKSDELTPFMQALILNPLSREIRDEFLQSLMGNRMNRQKPMMRPPAPPRAVEQSSNQTATIESENVPSY